MKFISEICVKFFEKICEFPADFWRENIYFWHAGWYNISVKMSMKMSLKTGRKADGKIF